MSSYTIEDILNSHERHKLFLYDCLESQLKDVLQTFTNKNIPVLNIGFELANFLNNLNDYRFLAIETYDFILKLLNKNKKRINNSENEIIAIHNLAILLEPNLELNAVRLFTEFSKSFGLIIIWENQYNLQDILNWPTQKQKFSLDFSDTTLRKLQHAI